MAPRGDFADHAVMTTAPDIYNYPAFSFDLHDSFERWLAEAPQLGDVAPAFELPDLEGRHHRLGDFHGKPTVIEFASYTCPIFCGHIPAMRQVARDHPEAAFVVVYAREAHPGEALGAHSNDADKRAAARRLATSEPIDRLLLVDDLDGTVHRRYGSAPDAAFVLDGNGRTVLRRAWNDPAQVGRALDDLRGGQVVPFESIDMSPPPNRDGFGHGLLRGGRQALIDFYSSAPPAIRQLLETSHSAAVRTVVAGAARADVARS